MAKATARSLTVGDLRASLSKFSDETTIWVLCVGDGPEADETYHAVNAYMDRIVGRAVVVVEPIAKRVGGRAVGRMGLSENVSVYPDRFSGWCTGCSGCSECKP